MKRLYAICLIPLLCVGLPAQSATKKAPAATTTKGVATIGWPQLVPESERAKLVNPASVDHGKGEERPRGNTLSSEDVFGALENSRQAPVYTPVRTWHNRKIRIPGYVVPVDYNSKGAITSFFLVPYFGACIHVPPPPPNQIIYVRYPAGFSVQALYEPFWVTGTLTVETMQSEIAESQYTLQGTAIDTYMRQ